MLDYCSLALKQLALKQLALKQVVIHPGSQRYATGPKVDLSLSPPTHKADPKAVPAQSIFRARFARNSLGLLLLLLLIYK